MDRITLARMGAVARPPAKPSLQKPNGEFARVLSERIDTDNVRFSAHAQRRLASRGIKVSADDHTAIRRGMDAAAEKGATAAVLLQGDRVFVVNVPNNTVITAHTAEESRAHVYTDINAAVVI